MSLSGLWVRSRFHRSNHKAKGHASPPVVVIIHSRGNSIISGTVLAPRPKATQSQSEFAMHGSRDEIYATGKALHEKCLRKGYADWKAAADRPDPGRSGLAGREGAVARTVTVAAWAHGALGIHLLRGAAFTMAFDLASAPSNGIRVQCCPMPTFVIVGGQAAMRRS